MIVGVTSTPPEPYNHNSFDLDLIEQYGSVQAALEATRRIRPPYRPSLFSQDPETALWEDVQILDSKPENRPRPAAISWDEYEAWLMPAWRDLLRSDPEEKDVQTFLEGHPALLPCASNDVGRGHHGACWYAVVSQPRLKGVGGDRVPDFMWVRRDTATIYVICIEIEAPRKRWFTDAGRSTAELNQALDQILEWKLWFSKPENMLAFRHAYIPPEMTHRRIEVQYILIFGRDDEFRSGRSRHMKPDLLRAKRDLMPRLSEYFYTFDQLRPHRDASSLCSIAGISGEFSMVGIPPTLQTGESTEVLASEVADITDALADTPLISEARRDYLASRWGYWRNRTLEFSDGIPSGRQDYGGWFVE